MGRRRPCAKSCRQAGEEKTVIPAFFYALLLLWGCASDSKGALRVAATPVPHAEMLSEIQGDLKKQGIDLQIVVVDDYILPNRLLFEKEVDANFFQHLPFLKKQEKEFGYRFSSLAKIHLEPLGIYSKRFQSLSSIPDKSSIALPNDPTNEARALNLLEKEGVIHLQEGDKENATAASIVSNPKGLTFLEVDAPMLPRALTDVAAAVIPGNFALQAGLDPLRDPLAKESTDSPYANILVIRIEEEGRPELQALKEAMTSEKMRAFILTKYKGAIIPVF
ncbi:MAG TPA: methionine ABC transporter substrate-binding protein [Parachlamydiales bacterium]|nr:methionine ABC transporter substrate-binding protein [Parachlamydiales bacterium]HCJ83336.1 methionine ABC transporter substrate-binding protein [Parachlamydiales bacterium]HCJ84015.1 methionine ABC transporter substrate-binding protein [Parachlamydiales bacterium]